MAKSWSLARRLTLTFAVTAAALATSIGTVSAWALRGSVERELQALGQEELEEMEILLAEAGLDAAVFEAAAEELGAKHPANPLAFLIWDPATGEEWARAGNFELPEIGIPKNAPPGEMVQLSSTLRWQLIQFPAGHGAKGMRLGLLLDGQPQVGLLRRYSAWAVTALALSTLLATLAGALLSRRITNILTGVAERIRSIQSIRGASGGDELTRLNAPREIERVVDAMQSLLGNIRTEADHAYLVTAGLAHELRSPVQNLLGECEVTLLRDREPEEYRRVLDSLVWELHDLGLVIDNLVSLTAPSSSPTPRPREEFDLGEEALLRLAREREEALRNKVKLSIETTGELAISGDREALLLALRNLVANAIKWTPKNGHVNVLIQGQGGQIQVRVDDAGPGIPEDQRERIFTPFFQVSGPQGKRAGYGLGLALAKMAIKAQGGQIAVSTSPLGGARLTMDIPSHPSG